MYADDQAAACWLNASVTSCPNPLAGLPRLPKPHYSWPFSLTTPNFSHSPVIQDCESPPCPTPKRYGRLHLPSRCILLLPHLLIQAVLQLGLLLLAIPSVHLRVHVLRMQ